MSNGAVLMTCLRSVSLILAASAFVAVGAQTADSRAAGQAQRRRADRVATPVYAVPRAPAGVKERQTWIPELPSREASRLRTRDSSVRKPYGRRQCCRGANRPLPGSARILPSWYTTSPRRIVTTGQPVTSQPEKIENRAFAS
jgi:hypothetical protein